MHFAVTCAEDASRLAETDPPGLGAAFLRPYREVCADWPRATLPSGFRGLPRSPAAVLRSPAVASASVTGFALPETSGYRHWVSASRPLAAVTAGGQPRVSNGSTSASRGIMNALRTLAFRPWSGEASTAFAVTS